MSILEGLSSQCTSPKMNPTNADCQCSTPSFPVNGPNGSKGSQSSNKMLVSERGTGVPPVNWREVSGRRVPDDPACLRAGCPPARRHRTRLGRFSEDWLSRFLRDPIPDIALRRSGYHRIRGQFPEKTGEAEDSLPPMEIGGNTANLQPRGPLTGHRWKSVGTLPTYNPEDL
jgi:hypothetical protein